MLVLIIAAVLLLAFNSNLLPLSFAPSDDYGILDDFESGLDNSVWESKGVIEQDGKAVLDLGDTLRYKGNLSGTRVRVPMTIETQFVNIARNTPCPRPHIFFNVESNGQVLCKSEATLVSKETVTTTFDVHVSDLNSTQGRLLRNGIVECEFNSPDYTISISDEHISVSCSTITRIDEVRARKRFNAKVDPSTEAVFQKTFSGPRVLTLNDFTVPVKSFSLANPVTVISSFDGGVDSTAEPLEILSRPDGEVEIPLGQTWIVLYIGDKRFTDGKQCIKAFDVDTKQCAEQILFVQECGDDQVLDPVSKECTTTLQFACDRAGGDLNIDGECVLKSTGEPIKKPINQRFIIFVIGLLALIFILFKRR